MVIKKAFVMLIMVLSLNGCMEIPVKSATIDSKHDKFSGEDIVKLSPLTINDWLHVELISSTKPGEKKQDNVAIVIRRNGVYDPYSDKWRYLDNHHGYLLVDSKSIDLGNGLHDGKVNMTATGGVYIMEDMLYSLSKNDLERFLTAVDIEGKIGNSEFKFTKPQVERIKEFSKMLLKRVRGQSIKGSA